MRLNSLPKSRLNATQRALFDVIAEGPRANGRQLFPLVDAEGALTGPFGILVHFPELGLPLQELGSAIRYRTGLSDRAREIAILCVAQYSDSAFERYAHERVGRAAGLSETELISLAAGNFASADAFEMATYALCQRLLAGDLPIRDSAYIELRDCLGEAAIFEVTVLVGYYRTLAQLLHVFDVGIPAEPPAHPNYLVENRKFP